MDLQHLPHAAVPYLNALYRGAAPSDEERAAFASLVEAARRWHAFMSDYHLDEDDSRSLANVRCLWDEVAQAFEAPPASLDALVTPLYAAVSGMEDVRRNRERPRFSTHAALNDVLQAGVAILQGRGTHVAVLHRLPVFETWLTNVTTIFEQASDRLAEAARVSFERGLRAMREGAEDMRDPTTLEAGLARARAAIEIVDAFLAWDRHQRQRFAARYGAYAIPVGGAALELALEELRSADRSQGRTVLEPLVTLVLPDLEAWWNAQRGVLLMPPALEAERTAEVDASLHALRRAVIALLAAGPVGAMPPLDGLEQAVVRTARAFEAVRASRLRSDALQGTEAATYFEAIEGVLSGTVPDLTLLTLMHARALPDSYLPVRDALLDYLAHGDRGRLIDACGLLLERADPPHAPASCPQCGAPVGSDGVCDTCGERAASTISWEA